MREVNDFTDLEVWKKCRVYRNAIFGFCKSLDLDEKYRACAYACAAEARRGVKKTRQLKRKVELGAAHYELVLSNPLLCWHPIRALKVAGSTPIGPCRPPQVHLLDLGLAAGEMRAGLQSSGPVT